MKFVIRGWTPIGEITGEGDSTADASQIVGFIASVRAEYPERSKGLDVAEGPEEGPANAAPVAQAVVKTPKETTRARARRRTAEAVVDAAQIEIPATAGKVVDLMDALKESLAAAPAAAPAAVVTEDAVFEAVKSLAARKGVPKVHEVFATFGIKKAGEIALEKRGELIAALGGAQ